MASDAQTKDLREVHYYWPNKMARMYLLSLEDAMGKNGVNAILNQAGLRQRIGNYPPDNLDLGWSFEDMSQLNQALDRVYGFQGGRELTDRAGRAWFHYALKDFGAVLGIADVAFRLLPSGTKIKLRLNAIAETFSRTGDQIVSVEERGDHFLYQILRCPECWGRPAQVPICHANLGLVREGLRWVTGGRHVQVDEVQCIAKGDPACAFRVDKHPD